MFEVDFGIYLPLAIVIKKIAMIILSISTIILGWNLIDDMFRDKIPFGGAPDVDLSYKAPNWLRLTIFISFMVSLYLILGTPWEW